MGFSESVVRNLFIVHDNTIKRLFLTTTWWMPPCFSYQGTYGITLLALLGRLFHHPLKLLALSNINLELFFCFDKLQANVLKEVIYKGMCSQVYFLVLLIFSYELDKAIFIASQAPTYL